jgi:hypothetical protein
MAITKSNKQELSLDHGKPNEKSGCTLATPYALMRSLILDSQIAISSLGSCTPLAHERCFSAEQMSKLTSNGRIGDIFIPPSINPNHYVPTQHFSYWPDVPVDVTGHVRSVATVDSKFKGAEWPDARTSPIRGDRTSPVAWNFLWKLSVSSSLLTGRTEAASDQ